MVRTDHRAALAQLRAAIRRLVPGAQECLSYGLPAFRLHGRPLIAFGAAGHHCALYPMSAATVAAHQQALAGYDTSKGTIRFQPDHPLPEVLVRSLVRARIGELRLSRENA